MRKLKVLAPAILAAALTAFAPSAAAANRIVEGIVLHCHSPMTLCADAEGDVYPITNYPGAQSGHRCLVEKDESGKVVSIKTPKTYFEYGTVIENMHGDIFLQVGSNFYACFDQDRGIPDGATVHVQFSDNCTDDKADDKAERIIWEFPLQ